MTIIPETQLGRKPPEMAILSDCPVTSIEDDLLKLDSRLSAVLDILRHNLTKCPITIAIYGDWGTGKTSAMHWLENQLVVWNNLKKVERQSHPRVYPVWFDPWKYHTREQVWRGIISEVILSLFSVSDLDRQNFIPRMKEAAIKFGSFLGRSFLHALANIELTLKTEAGSPGMLAGGSELKFDGKMISEICDDFDSANHPEKAYLNQFEDTLKSWVRDFLKDDARIALFIDDLDRCLPQVTLEVLEAIKLYLNIPQIIFVVGLDRSMVDGVIRKHYAEHGVGQEKAEKYLDKIFQVEIHISPSQTQMAEFHLGQIRFLDKATGGYWGKKLDAKHKAILESGINELSRGNPRELKRLLNSALLRGRAAVDNILLSDVPPDVPRFAQGVQFFLVQRIVQKRIGAATSLLLRSSALKWFEDWSKILKTDAQYRPLAPDEATMTDKSLRAKAFAQRGIAFEQLKALDTEFQSLSSTILYVDDANSMRIQAFLEEELLWTLLTIPFSAEVAQSAPNLERPKPVSDNENSSQTQGASSQPDLLKAMPDVMRICIAKSMDKPLDELNVSDILTVTKLDFRWSHLEDDDLSYLTQCKALESLYISGPEITDAGLRSLEKLASLRKLGFWESPITDDGLKLLQRLPLLTSLNLVRTRITNHGLESLENITSLRILNLTESKITDDGVPSLQKLTTLQKLNLTGIKLTKGGIEALKRALPNTQIIQ